MRFALVLAVSVSLCGCSYRMSALREQAMPCFKKTTFAAFADCVELALRTVGSPDEIARLTPTINYYRAEVARDWTVQDQAADLIFDAIDAEVRAEAASNHRIAVGVAVGVTAAALVTTAVVVSSRAGRSGRASQEPVVVAAPVPVASNELFVFGGAGHNQFLGCLTCSEYEATSVSNKYGRFGNEFGSDAITNKFGRFGSSYSSESACNRFATTPPVIVGRNGASYGNLTLNQFASPIRDADVIRWLESVCAH